MTARVRPIFMLALRPEPRVDGIRALRGARREKFAVARVCKPELISTARLVCRNPNLRSEASLDRPRARLGEQGPRNVSRGHIRLRGGYLGR
jgi:hypothetical protein